MQIRFMVSHPWNNRPGRIKMAKVDGCTFFKRESGWKHVDKSCKGIFHWVWEMIMTINQCTLVRKDGEWKHQNGCLDSQIYNEIQEKGAGKVRERIEKEMSIPQPDPDDKVALETWRIMAEAMAIKLALVTKVEKEKPACLLDPDYVPQVVGGCGFFLDGDVFKHQCELETGFLCKLREHYQDFGDRKVRLTRTTGWKVEEFVKKANEAIGQAIVMVPPESHKHITVEV